MRKLELLAPAADKNVAIEAILHGADAVYMGATSHGARRNASNSLDDIKEVIDFAHQFRARVYVTVNTLVYENEIRKVERLVRDLYEAGTDALIVQDMSLLRMDIPPIALHASTQCDTRTVEKARFLESVGFSQIVLARELSIEEIAEICRSVKVPVECFIHGALCVSYSGRCQASERCLGRSANRGECAQMCRLPYTLRNGRGEVLEKDKYLLSLRDFSTYDRIPDLIRAGASSFKIEGRLKDAAYVKNVTAAYRKIIDKFIAENSKDYCRSSFGRNEISFSPDIHKSFNRGFTGYFLDGRKDVSMAGLLTPKSMGERIRDPKLLRNGDGISYINPSSGKMEGAYVNGFSGSRIRTSSGRLLNPGGLEIRRTFDVEWQKKLDRPTGRRKIAMDILVDEEGISASDERGVFVRIPMDAEKSESHKPMQIDGIFSKLGNTVYEAREIVNNLNPTTFIPASQLTALRRKLVEAADEANIASYPFEYRRKEDKTALFPEKNLVSSDNVANSLAREFYIEHGVTSIVPALEISTQTESGEEKSPIVMTTRYCLRRELGCCRKKNIPIGDRKRFVEPLTITSGPHAFILDFDCERCEMKVRKAAQPIQNQTLPDRRK